MKRLAIASFLALAAPYARADEATARATFKQAEDLRKAGKWADACPLYEASYRDDPQLGVLLHLADCHEKIGKLATAYSEFTDASELAQKRGDPRAAGAKAEADALLPRVPKLHISPPPKLIPGLAVKRDGADVTVLVGTDMPIDAGDHDITASAPGFVTVTKKVTIAGEGTVAQLPLPALEKEVEKPVVVAPAKVHEGLVRITTQPDAHIQIDTYDVGLGHYQAKLRSGGHTLRVTAPGMRAYQTEIFVADDEARTIDVPLERETSTSVVARPPVIEVPDDRPRYELGASIAPGTKRLADNPAMIAYRLDFGFRLGETRRVNLGAFVEYASIKASGTCGTYIPGPMPSSPYDYGLHNQFERCEDLVAGAQLYVHILPEAKIDPYIALVPSFRAQHISYTPFDTNGNAQPSQDMWMPGVVVGVRAGAEYHPLPEFRGLGVGAFLQIDTIVKAQENFDSGGKLGNPASGYVNLFGGLRSSLTF